MDIFRNHWTCRVSEKKVTAVDMTRHKLVTSDSRERRERGRGKETNFSLQRVKKRANEANAFPVHQPQIERRRDKGKVNGGRRGE